MADRMKFHLISLGCPKNTADSEGLIGTLQERGIDFAQDPSHADLVLVNTCGFIREAKEESLRELMNVIALKKDRPHLRVIAFGCLVKRYEEELRQEIPELDGLFTFFTGKELDSFLPVRRKVAGTPLPDPDKPRPRVLTPSHVGFLKVAEGCDNRCAYCAIPDIRGAYRSRPLDEVLKDAARLAASGAREMSIIAQDTTRYGSEWAPEEALVELVRKVGELPSVEWIRLHYLHPKRLTFGLIERLFTLPKVLPYFDIPFQHVSDRILQLMNRGYTGKDLVTLIGFIRRSFRKAVLRTSLIVGFPGETEQDFRKLVKFIEDHPIDRLGAFPYSTEEGTPAARITPKIARSVRQRRLDELMTLQGLLAAERNAKLVGGRRQILIDRIEGETAFGRTYADALEIDNETSLPYDGSFKVGDFVTVRLTGADAYDFTAEKLP